ncbi:cysteine desulfurase family protein [Halobacteriovorax sp. GB3]|uniref:cysteine desulfurase family protein n=1 Tax=Halobacteriovorax sp. GB3 TaxID=2719615 RepID=UPI002360F23D|nr:cysteine desulfurase family protein [Halobacteriovorax sp. GB3]MDD0854264.1 cysteine desulfurase family protein [Halobacteriovorax sp. GB3]
MIYADYNGSAPICDDVKDYLIERLKKDGPYANPNAIHYLGSKTLMGMENARSICSKVLGADYNQVIFNSGATEGISHVFHSCLDNAQELGIKAVIVSGIEHSAVINSAKAYANKGVETKILPTLNTGIIDLSALESWLADYGKELGLVAIMAANNETGIIQPYEKVAELCNKHDVPFLCDTTQYIGKTIFNFKKSGADYAVTSGHKFGALTGAGILLAKDPTSLRPLIIGGGQEKGHRGGTQNYIGNETLAVALKNFEKNLDKIEALNSKRLEFEAALTEKFPEVVIIGKESPRLASTTYVSFPGIHGQAVQIELESQDIFVTTSSACSDNEPVTSKVLKAMGVTDEVGRGVVRISLGLCSPLEYYDEILDALTKAYEKLGKIKSY